jgi:hypothetical protein
MTTALSFPSRSLVMIVRQRGFSATSVRWSYSVYWQTSRLWLYVGPVLFRLL